MSGLQVTNVSIGASCRVLCVFRQVQASNDASLLWHKIFSLYVHISRRCSSSSLSSYHSVSHKFLTLPFCLLSLGLYTEGIYFSTHDLTNCSVFVGWCSSSSCFHPPCPKPLDWIDVQSNWSAPYPHFKWFQSLSATSWCSFFPAGACWHWLFTQQTTLCSKKKHDHIFDDKLK